MMNQRTANKFEIPFATAGAHVLSLITGCGRSRDGRNYDKNDGKTDDDDDDDESDEIHEKSLFLSLLCDEEHCSLHQAVLFNC